MIQTESFCFFPNLGKIRSELPNIQIMVRSDKVKTGSSFSCTRKSNPQRLFWGSLVPSWMSVSKLANIYIAFCFTLFPFQFDMQHDHILKKLVLTTI